MTHQHRPDPSRLFTVPYVCIVGRTATARQDAVPGHRPGPEGRTTATNEPEAPNLSEALTELAALLLRAETVDDLMEKIAQLVHRYVPAEPSCAILLAVAERTLTIGSSDERARLLDERLYDVEEGPSGQALRTGEIVISQDLAAEARWGGYPAMARARGIESLHASPLHVRGSVLGVLTIYATKPHAFGAAERALIADVAALGAAGMAATLRNFDETGMSNHLRAALATRSVIDQAIGIVVGLRRIPPPRAFVLLRNASQRRNIRLAVLAADLIQEVATGGDRNHLDWDEPKPVPGQRLSPASSQRRSR